MEDVTGGNREMSRAKLRMSGMEKFLKRILPAGKRLAG